MNFYEIHPVNSHVFVIAERLSKKTVDTMILVVGQKKAALVDTGTGIGDLRAVVNSLTKLPVMVLSTHAHNDHIGGNPLFDECYLNQEDAFLIPESMGISLRLSFLAESIEDERRIKSARKTINRIERFSYHPVEDGDLFDLGGIHLRTIAFSGHTPGSLMYLIEEDRILLSGDAINRSPWIFLPYSCSVETYFKRLCLLSPQISGVKEIYCGHSCEGIGVGVLDDLRYCCEEILDGRQDRIVQRIVGSAAVYAGHDVRVFYDPGRVRG